MWLTASPWRMRDWIEYLTANEGRFKKVCIARAALGVLLLVLGVTAFK